MDETRAPYGASLLVAVGWYVTVFLGVAVGNWSTPDAPPTPCESGTMGGCMDASVIVTAIAVMSSPLQLAVLAAVTAGVTRLPLPAVIAGSLSAVAAALVVLVGAVALVAN